MHNLSGKRILLGICGGIAAYKSAELLRRLREHGAEVRVVMTPAATEFITPLTFQALSGQTVRCDLFDTDAEAAMGHIELARWADAVLLAPCSANTLAKLANGMADNLLTSLCLASDAPLAIAPAMNQQMWLSSATQANIEIVRQRGVAVFGPDSGAQACGEIGQGRMQEPSALLDAISGLFQTGHLSGRRVVITAGPTRETIDPVRYLSNHSSGRMGFALAAAAADAGALVELISGPVDLKTPARVQRVDVISAAEMQQAVMQTIANADIFIACAAVADYRLAEPAAEKISKQAATWQLELTQNPDILAQVAALPKPPFTLGFAAETAAMPELANNARRKLMRKNIDMIAANQVGPGLGFDVTENALEVFWRTGQQSLSKTSKDKLARQLLQLLAERYCSTITTDHASTAS